MVSPGVIRRPVKAAKNNTLPREIIVLDDDDPILANRAKKKFTSTPTDSGSKEVSFPDSDDIKFVREFKSSYPRDNIHKDSLGFLKPISLMKNIIPGKRKENTDVKISSPNSPWNSGGKYNRPFMSNFTNRLDDKRLYQNLLDTHMCKEDSFNNSSQYYTPNSRLSKYDFSDRGKKILELSRQKSRNNSITPVIDLTHEEMNGHFASAKSSVKEKIKRVLDSYEEEMVEIQDSESDVEILPSPPSPKPDFKVDPVNSMKTVVDTSYVSNKKWLADIVEKHKLQIEKRSKDLEQLKESSNKLNAINRDIRIGNLTRQIDKCLLIKDAVLPIEETEPELPQLTPEQCAIVNKAFKGNPNEIMVKKFNLNITRKDILTLAGLNWLNDEVINFYMNLIMERSTESAGRLPKVYCFNTFFYPKLVKDGPESLRRWTRRIDIFSMDIICIPIHLGMHWCMSIIDFRDLSIKYYDSMGSSNHKCLSSLRRYLEAEHLDKKKTSYDTSDYNLECVKDIPQQMNGSDCGMFSCTFAEFYSRGAKFIFKQEDMPYLRSKMVVEIITGELLIK
ncbi:hypothetical protein WA026_022063 [Henosepilachna vigintioctopunctata]